MIKKPVVCSTPPITRVWRRRDEENIKLKPSRLIRSTHFAKAELLGHS